MSRRMFLSETHPAAVFAEQAPGPGWTPARDATPPTPAAAPRDLAELLDALSTAMAVVPAQETPGDAFHRLAELRAQAEGCSLVEAYQRQSISTPELWADVRDRAPRGY
jgi:hypothetical protein